MTAKPQLDGIKTPRHLLDVVTSTRREEEDKIIILDLVRPVSTSSLLGQLLPALGLFLRWSLLDPLIRHGQTLQHWSQAGRVAGVRHRTEPHFELTERMPHLTDPKVIEEMRLAVADVSKTRSVLRNLGERPDHETVDAARAKLAEIESSLSKELEEIVLDESRKSQQEVKEEENRKTVETEREMYKAVIVLEKMHDEYEKLLKKAEEKLEKIYETAAAGGGGVSELGESSKMPLVEEIDQEVVAILEDASAKGVEGIDLSNRRLRLLPEDFGTLRGLLRLNLSTNQLEAIPDSIAGLENLEELNLSSNLLESLPDSIGFLIKLKVLDVSSNKLDSLPDSICRCRSLVELDASFNKLTYLPTNIGYELVYLRQLSVQLNKIRSLPTSIGEMVSLRLLDVHFNELRGLPLSIGRLTNLEILNLSGNFSDLRELPETLGDLTNLKELDLSNNQIQELPVTFGRLDKLCKLNLEQNPIAIPPKEVVDEGVEAVKVFMAKRWLDILVEAEEKSMLEVKEQNQTGWLTRSTSWLSAVAGGVSEYLSPRAKPDAYLDQQL